MCVRSNTDRSRVPVTQFTMCENYSTKHHQDIDIDTVKIQNTFIDKLDVIKIKILCSVTLLR